LEIEACGRKTALAVNRAIEPGEEGPCDKEGGKDI